MPDDSSAGPTPPASPVPDHALDAGATPRADGDDPPAPAPRPRRHPSDRVIVTAAVLLAVVAVLVHGSVFVWVFDHLWHEKLEHVRVVTPADSAACDAARPRAGSGAGTGSGSGAGSGSGSGPAPSGSPIPG